MKELVLMKIAAWRIQLLAAKMNAQGLKKETWEEICHAEILLKRKLGVQDLYRRLLQR